jgi:hypothetical protein
MGPIAGLSSLRVPHAVRHESGAPQMRDPHLGSKTPDLHRTANAMRGVRGTCLVNQYAAGSGESVGFSKARFSAGLIGMFRLTFFGGMACVNHFAYSSAISALL